MFFAQFFCALALLRFWAPKDSTFCQISVNEVVSSVLLIRGMLFYFRRALVINRKLILLFLSTKISTLVSPSKSLLSFLQEKIDPLSLYKLVGFFLLLFSFQISKLSNSWLVWFGVISECGNKKVLSQSKARGVYLQ